MQSVVKWNQSNKKNPKSELDIPSFNTKIIEIEKYKNSIILI